MEPQNQHYESNYPLDTDQISEWVEQFHRDGFLFLEDVLQEEHIAQLKADLDWSLAHFTSRDKDPNGKLSPQSGKSSHRLCHRMFEHSQANLNLFDLEPIVSFAEALVAANCHVIHNNSFITPPRRWPHDLASGRFPSLCCHRWRAAHKYPPARTRIHL